MGCAGSKFDDLPAVALCRKRCAFLDEAIRLRYSLAEAHMGYVQSLKGVGHSLHFFLEQDFGKSAGGGGGDVLSPKLNLQAKRKGDPVDTHKKAAVSHHKHSSSGSHLHFHSDSDDDDSGGSLHHHSDVSSSPLHSHVGHIDHMDSDQDALGFPGGFMHMNYMKNKATPSVLYEQRPMNPEIVRMGEASSYYPNQYSNNNSNSNQYNYYGYSDYDGGGGGGMGGYYGLPPTYGSSSSPPPPVASSSKPPPPPPSPPRSSGWDFLNPFESYDKYYPPYTPTRDPKEVREEEGIPDLEDEDYYQQEVVKEVHGAQKFVDVGGEYSKASKAAVLDEDGKSDDREASSLYHSRPSVSMENEGLEYDVHVVEKKVVDNEERSEEHSIAGAFKGSREAPEVAREIEAQFLRASEAGNEITKMLEVGKLPYSRKHVSSMMLHVVTPSLSIVSSQPSTSKSAEASSSTNKANPASLGFDEEVAMSSGNLSSTLQKLHLWEKKLYNEVKAEEKMRVIHDRKCQKLKRMDQRGAEAHKIDTTRTLIRSLSTKIRIAIQVVDKISVTINKIRDEELWPQLNELIQGLSRMWKRMLECHHSQYLAIREARAFTYTGFGKNFSDAHHEATLQLEHELINWTIKFSSWISTQKGFIRALNNWLMKCLPYEPEETVDGPVPFSPGRIGAPPVFVICNQWCQALDKISEKEVVDSMRVFTMSMFQIWEQDKLEMRQRMMANKDLERKVRLLDKEDQKIQKEIQALDKKIVLFAAGDGGSLSVPVYQSDTSNSSLQARLQRIFEAMARFTADSMKAYEELLQRSEEEKNAREHERVS